MSRLLSLGSARDGARLRSKTSRGRASLFFSIQTFYSACFSTSLEDLVGRSLDNVTSLRGAYVAAAAGILQVLELREVVSQIGEILGHSAAHAQVHVVEALRYFLVCVLQHCK
ncbi:MAG: hypothetical protein RL156_285 [Bacteroidota bacterium]